MTGKSQFIREFLKKVLLKFKYLLILFNIRSFTALFP